jgi:hypothetical protein
MAALSGILGAVDGIVCVRGWSVNLPDDLQAWAGSNTAGAEGNEIGNRDWNGNYRAYGGQPEKMPGDTFTFAGSIEGTKGVTGSAIVDSVEINWNQESGARIEHTVNFGGNGAPTVGASVAVDGSVPVPSHTSIGCIANLLTVAANPVPTEIPGIRSMSLRIAAANPSYVDSSTGGWHKRKKGTISLEASLAVYCADFATAGLPVANDVKGLQLYVNATEYWEINWIVWGPATDLTVDRERASIVTASYSGKLVVSQTINAVDTVGSIILPDQTTWWPPA